jgi:hypothetical protein
MRTLTRLAVAVGVVVSTAASCHRSSREPSSAFTANLASAQGLDSLWSLRVVPQLTLPLWRDDLTYEAGHMLMVPLHAAYDLRVPAWQQQFAAHFARAVDSGFVGLPRTENAQDRAHYLYLATRFMVLDTRASGGALIPPGLRDAVRREVDYVWRTLPAWMWDRPDFPGGIRERIAWKLAAQRVDRSYYPAVIDIELYLLAIAADLRQLELADAGARPSALTTEVLTVAERIFRSRVERTADGGVLFQRGVWADHPDYEYAGRNRKERGMRPSKVDRVAEDASHAHRTALWLTSLRDAHERGTAGFAWYDTLRCSLSRQFHRKVLVHPTSDFPGLRTTNFMDGRNGVYRWKFAQRGDTWGYGPHELSGTIALGWWSFLRTPESRETHRRLAASYPLAPRVAALYLAPHGPTLPPERDWTFNGLGALIAKLSAELPVERCP